ncbi:MAG: hypothetical protein ACR2HR_09980 [Euzebya sp.]
MRILLSTTLLVVTALLLTGCRLTLELDLNVSTDGGGTLEVSVSTDDELEELARSAGVDPLSRMVQRVQALEGSWRVSDERNDTEGGRTVTLRTSFADPAQFQARYLELSQALDAPEAQVLGPLDLSIDPQTDLITVTGSLPLLLTDVAATDLGTDVATLTQRLTDVVDSSLTLTTPGSVVQANATTVLIQGQPAAAPFTDGPAVLTWQAAPGQSVPVATTFEPGGASVVRLLIMGGVGVLAVGLIAGGVVAGRRRSATAGTS